MPQNIPSPDRMLRYRLHALKKWLSGEHLGWFLSLLDDKNTMRTFDFALEHLLQTHHHARGLAHAYQRVNFGPYDASVLVSYILESKRLAQLLAKKYHCAVPEDNSECIIDIDENEEPLRITVQDLANAKAFFMCDKHTVWHQLPYLRDITLSEEQRAVLSEREYRIKQNYNTRIDKLIEQLGGEGMPEDITVLNKEDVRQLQQTGSVSKEMLERYQYHLSIVKKFAHYEEQFDALFTSLKNNLRHIGISTLDLDAKNNAGAYSALHRDLASIGNAYTMALHCIKPLSPSPFFSSQASSDSMSNSITPFTPNP